MYIHQPSFAFLLISTLIGHCYTETEEAPYKVENNCKNVNAPTTIIYSRALRFAILQKKVDPCLFVHAGFATNLPLFQVVAEHGTWEERVYPATRWTLI